MGKFIILQLDNSEDYILREIMNRITTLFSEEPVIEHITKREELVLKFAQLSIYPLQYQVCIDGNDIGLRANEFEILLLLSSSIGQVFSKEQIYRAVWRQEPVNCVNTVMCCISQLRKKIESDPRNPQFIQTVRGVGYKFVNPPN